MLLRVSKPRIYKLPRIAIRRPFSLATHGKLATNLQQFETHEAEKIPKHEAPPATTPAITHAMQALSKILHIHTLDDWKDVPIFLVRELSTQLPPQVSWALRPYHNIKQLLVAAYPDHKWETEKTFSVRGVRQKFMERVVRTIFPDAEIERNKRDLDLVSENGFPLEIDCYLPEHKLGFEFHEQHHYFEGQYSQLLSLSEIQKRDKSKLDQANALGITLITVPIWWDYKKESLIATIKKYKPDLLPMEQVSVAPISEEIPDYVREDYDTAIPGFGSVMLPQPQPKSSVFNPEGWWVFEKYDGIRAVWHPGNKQFYSRRGKPLRAPEWLRDSLAQLSASTAYDGEFWFGLGAWNEAIKVSSRYPLEQIRWDDFKYIVFDAIVQDVPFFDRYALLKREIPQNHKYVTVANYTKCTSIKHMEDLFNDVVHRTGEGLIVRNPKGFYTPGFTKEMYKQKTVKDASAMLEKQITDRLWVCSVPSRTAPGEIHQEEILVEEGCELGELKEGDIVSLKYYYFTDGGGTHMNPKIYRKRPDLIWDNVISKKHQVMLPKRKVVYRPPVTWLLEQTRRTFFDDFARARHFNPLVAENWYAVKAAEIRACEGGAGVLRYYDGSYVRALMALYPKIGLKPSGFLRTPVNYWDDRRNRRKFFEEFAALKKFTTRQAAPWYGYEPADFEEVFPKEAKALFQRFPWPEVLVTAFPEVHFDSSTKFKTTAENVDFSDPALQQVFFDQLAKEKGFEKTLAENWYKVTREEILAKKGGNEIVALRGGYIPAIVAAYPDIGLELMKFPRVTDNYWKDPKNRRQFFDEYARDHNFDPLEAGNWYSVLYEELVQYKGGGRVIRYHGTYARALKELYPEVNFNMERFKKTEHWTNKENRRQFFDEFAAERAFDPLEPENWYGISRKSIIEKRGGRTVIDYHGSIPKALTELYPEVTFDQNRFKRYKHSP
eukprot:Phypoly_transcript_01764.p1 GENE.Phypoly_transcript_01764~~Phypoly_transcript_01764.p1  ORF type:complete len:946 (-),score=154.63 Phypoly_transcript_01764:299-3136(-)